MNNLALSLISAILIGLGATLTTDLWALFLKRAFKIAAPNYCLVGRWLRYMPEGIFKHSNIASAPQKSAECTVGWIAHYMIGVMFALASLLIVDEALRLLLLGLTIAIILWGSAAVVLFRYTGFNRRTSAEG